MKTFRAIPALLVVFLAASCSFSVGNASTPTGTDALVAWSEAALEDGVDNVDSDLVEAASKVGCEWVGREADEGTVDEANLDEFRELNEQLLIEQPETDFTFTNIIASQCPRVVLEIFEVGDTTNINDETLVGATDELCGLVEQSQDSEIIDVVNTYIASGNLDELMIQWTESTEVDVAWHIPALMYSYCPEQGERYSDALVSQ